MQIKLYLPVFFLLIISGKILVLDSALQVLAPENPEFGIYKPLCKKRWAKRSPQASFLQKNDSQETFQFHLICHQNFWFERTPETGIPFQANYTKYQYFAPPETEVYIRNLYPPPKLLQNT